MTMGAVGWGGAKEKLVENVHVKGRGGQNVRWDIRTDVDITHGDGRVWDKEENCEQGVKFYEWVKELGDFIVFDQHP